MQSRRDFLFGAGAGIATVKGIELGVRAFSHKEESQHYISFAQSGEDLIANYIFQGALGIEQPSYLDIGTYDPIVINNTYLFYCKGSRGVLVEPNVDLYDKLSKTRPGDKVLSVGVGVTDVAEADYYLMTEPSWNTFSKEEVEHMTRITEGRIQLKKVIKMPLVNINRLIAENFTQTPNFLSIDIEGLDLAVLKTLDFSRYRPEVVVAQTLITGTHKDSPEIREFMATRDYVVRGQTFVNTLFVDKRKLKL